MKPFTPQVRLIRKTTTNDYFVHVILWTDHVKYIAVNSAFVSASGVHTVTLNIKEDAGALNIPFLSAMTFVVPLTGITFGTGDAAILNTEVYHTGLSRVVGKRKTHKDDAEDTAMPD